MTVVRTFLPWYRAGLATALDGPPPAGTARAAVPATVRMRGTPRLGEVDVPLQLAGPGDVVALDQREVLRTEPYDGCTDFEPSYFPYVELGSPDLPWRFTPFGPTTAPLPNPEGDPVSPREQQRLQPWIALVVVPTEASTLTAAPRGGLPVLECDATELPDPSEAWAWAHVQLTHDADRTPAAAAADAAGRMARLLCPRRLEPRVRYLACLVPTFAAGRAALITDTPVADPLTPAWPSTGPVRLPVYLQWSFVTGDAGSFEALVRRLRPRPVPGGAAGRQVATGAPGWGAVSGSPDATVVVQGALRPIGVPEPPATDVVLAASLRTAVSRSGPGAELRPPLYGQDHHGGTTTVPPDDRGWLAELNTDPRRRLAAGLASWAVAVHQEELVDDAWRQLAAARATRPAGGDADLAAAVAGAVADRHGLGTAPQPVRGAPTTAAPERFAPRFAAAAYALLRAVGEEWMLPAAGDLPADSVALVQTNGAFVESFLIGLNHALARELVWRRYPLDVAGTFVDRFWADPAGGGGGHPADIAPIASWGRHDPLGGHGSATDDLVLLVRGELLRRFPNASVYLSRTAADGSERQLLPRLSGAIGADVAFLGFPLTPEQAVHGSTAEPGSSDWSVVVQEPLGHARFGCDEPPAGVGPDVPLSSWQDLHWSHQHVADRRYVPVAGPLAGVRRPVSRGAAAAAVWGLDAANLAVATQQPAFRVRIPIRLWLEPLLPAPHG